MNSVALCTALRVCGSLWKFVIARSSGTNFLLYLLTWIDLVFGNIRSPLYVLLSVKCDLFIARKTSLTFSVSSFSSLFLWSILASRHGLSVRGPLLVLRSIVAREVCWVLDGVKVCGSYSLHHQERTVYFSCSRYFGNIMSSLLPLLRCGLSSLATRPSLSFLFFLHIPVSGRFSQAATGYRFVARSQSNGCLCANSVAFCTCLRICGSSWRPGLELLVVFLFVVWSECSCFGYCLVDEVLASGAFLCLV